MTRPQLADTDRPRLSRQVDRLKAYFRRNPGVWLTPFELARVCGASEAGATARARDLRKQKFGGWTVTKRIRQSPGLFEYRASPPGEPHQLEIVL